MRMTGICPTCDTPLTVAVSASFGLDLSPPDCGICGECGESWYWYVANSSNAQHFRQGDETVLEFKCEMDRIFMSKSSDVALLLLIRWHQDNVRHRVESSLGKLIAGIGQR